MSRWNHTLSLLVLGMVSILGLGGCYMWKAVPSNHLGTVLKDKVIVFVGGDSTGSIWSLENVRIVEDSLFGLVVKKSSSMPLSEIKSMSRLGYQSIYIRTGAQPVEDGSHAIALALDDLKKVQAFTKDSTSTALLYIVLTVLAIPVAILLFFGLIYGG